MKILFYLPAVLFLIAGLPQAIKLIKTKSSGDISILMYVITLVAVSIVIVDAYINHNNSILVANATSFFIVTLNLVLIIKYRKKY